MHVIHIEHFRCQRQAVAAVQRIERVGLRQRAENNSSSHAHMCVQPGYRKPPQLRLTLSSRRRQLAPGPRAPAAVLIASSLGRTPAPCGYVYVKTLWTAGVQVLGRVKETGSGYQPRVVGESRY